ncbi:uncharacterized protein TEOVI_000323600 [Trypanosoma equiperdum]|uniref:Transmembrane protein n=4 Tax=Trypanozoon TaxID=39700 RepID=Q389R4_TRYB2|nr:hypothetical protein, conserved [Trypanosoma brucei gambiense DAL972]XP_823284.1 hypothetical protein, conserved [Trypanosoma brucei brucei TREU927]RHW68563.1 hypothetical protein DPX39_100112800 [Trypanosoma brucei equiperdum]SCU71655.1 hypothetical protein, conserved [Trypanosoma equiperdum]EAN78456.1 hypothetical protein, conserved [Trypanosoma brucei brucei TREU927]CBH16194.1 hypothetical protein, conserved [Trypanosoma brucei gambiense DAL972]|eukprot:XP_011778458.1 hypothetical protein, conserved [Trypanosoma brucei gambiense DAL972]
MPRAYYKPFTVYEEVVGFHGARRNAYICCAILFGGLLFKILVLSQYSTVTDYSGVDGLQSNPDYQAMLAQREALAQSLSSREEIHRAIASRRAPPA